MKRFLQVLALVLCIPLLSGFIIFGDDPADYWDTEWYGWYEVTEASGIYAQQEGYRTDCIAMIDLEGTSRGSTEGSFVVYDPDHYDDNYLAMRADFNKVEITVKEGSLLGSPIVSHTIVMQPEEAIGIAYALWAEGSLVTEEGSVTLRMFLFRGDQDVMAAMEETGTGELKEPLSTLKPDGYETYRNVKDKEEYRYDRYLAGYNRFSNPLEITWLQEDALQQILPFVKESNDAKFVQVQMKKHEDLMEVQIQNESGASFYQAPLETREKDLVLQLRYPETVGQYTITFVDLWKHTYTYTLRLDDAGHTIQVEERGF